MFSSKSLSIFFVALSLCICSVAATSNNTSNGNFQFVVGELPNAFVIKVVGNQNVPMFQYFMTNTYIVKYKLQMSSVYEANISSQTGAIQSKYPGTSLSLASLDWVFSQPQLNEETNETSFNISNSGTDSHGRWDSLTFVNHITNTSSSSSSSSSNDTESQVHSFKFDVILEGYQWQSEDPEAGLVVEFGWTYEVGNLPIQPSSDAPDNSTDPNNGRVRQDDPQTLRLMQALLRVAPEAIDGEGGAVGVTLSYEGGEGGKVQLVYQHFNGSSLFHDPTVGIDESQPLGPNVGNSTSSSSDGDGDGDGDGGAPHDGATSLHGSVLLVLGALGLTLLFL